MTDECSGSGDVLDKPGEEASKDDEVAPTTSKEETVLIEQASEQQGELEEQSKPFDNMLELDSMKDAVWFLYPDRKDRVSKFFLLITCAAIIATMGLANDSAATVIGAMIVAPLMTPILGTMLGIVLVDEPNIIMSFGLVCAGAATAILIGLIFGFMLNPLTIVAENNSQVAARTEPNLNDLIAALATGAVGSIALVRKDIAGTLPGVAIAISLVPPLCVVGMTISTKDYHDSLGAFLLFSTNFASIIMTGIIVMYIYGVHKMGGENSLKRLKRILAIFTVLALVVIVAIPLTYSSNRIGRTRNIEYCLEQEIDNWAEPYGWETAIVIAQTGKDTSQATVLVTGLPPFPSDTDDVPDLIKCGVEEITLRFLPQRVIELD